MTQRVECRRYMPDINRLQFPVQRLRQQATFSGVFNRLHGIALSPVAQLLQDGCDSQSFKVRLMCIETRYCSLACRV